METIKQDRELVCKTRGIRRISLSPGQRHVWGQSLTASNPIDVNVVRSNDRFQSDNCVAFFSPRRELYPASELRGHLNHCLEHVLLPKLRNQAQIEGITTDAQ